jgi:hypothetical protein
MEAREVNTPKPEGDGRGSGADRAALEEAGRLADEAEEILGRRVVA